MPPAPSCFSYFWIGSQGQHQTMIFLSMLPARIADVPHKAWLVCRDAISLTFFFFFFFKLRLTLVSYLYLPSNCDYRCALLCLAVLVCLYIQVLADGMQAEVVCATFVENPQRERICPSVFMPSFLLRSMQWW
jgi:hypothetical protein